MELHAAYLLAYILAGAQQSREFVARHRSDPECETRLEARQLFSGEWLTNLGEAADWRRSRRAYRLCRLDPFLSTVIWKDPIACFASKAAVDRIPVVVTVRPATAIAASYVRMQWNSGLQPAMESLAQVGIVFPELMENFGKYLGNRPIEAAMLWQVTYSTLLQWAETRPLIHFVSTQDSIDRPVDTYRSLFAVLDLRSPSTGVAAPHLRPTAAMRVRNLSNPSCRSVS
jgi:hypothetical protein